MILDTLNPLNIFFSWVVFKLHSIACQGGLVLTSKTEDSGKEQSWEKKRYRRGAKGEFS